MSRNIVEYDGNALRRYVSGFSIVGPRGKPRYYGSLSTGLRSLGWIEAADAVDMNWKAFRDQSRNYGPIKVYYPGISGTQISVSKPKNRFVEIFLTYQTDAHLAKGQTASRRLFPGNQGQALGLMLETDIEDESHIKGAFSDQGEFLRFMESRLEGIEHALKLSEPLNEDHSDGSDEDNDSDLELDDLEEADTASEHSLKERS